MNLVHREPNFENILKILRHEKPDRPTLFECFMNDRLYANVLGRSKPTGNDLETLKYIVDAFAALGYDYAYTSGCIYSFNPVGNTKIQTRSLNENCFIHDEESFENFPWPTPKEYDYSVLEKIEPFLPSNMKLMLCGNYGILENTIDLVGYENLCIMLFENPDLVQAIFDKIGSIYVEHYEIGAQYNSVGVIMSNDDWGFNMQTLLSPPDMRKYVFPWHKKIVEIAHKNGKPALLHSCGNLSSVMEDIICDMKYDGKHSYEDNILSVEECYARLGERIAILGGIDLNFLINSDLPDITRRALNLLEMSKEKSGYALGSGNSIPKYVPDENYFAMTRAVVEF